MARIAAEAIKHGGKVVCFMDVGNSSEDATRNSAVLSYDEILAALSDDPDAARLEIERKRADIETAKLEQRRLMSLGQFRLYLETLDHQTLAWQKAMGRKNGATANDHKLKANFEVQLGRQHLGTGGTGACACYDLHALLW